MSNTSRQPSKLRDAQGQYLKALGRLCDAEDLAQRKRLVTGAGPHRERSGGGYRIVRKQLS